MKGISERFLVAVRSSLRAALPGMFLAILTVLLGWGLGIGFGANEDYFKSRIAASAAEVRETVYGSNDAEIQKVRDKSWAYLKRSHLHASSIGNTALSLIVLVVLLGGSVFWTRAVSLALGLGGFGYSVYWLIAGFRAPGMGSTAAAKESLAWLAMPSAGLLILGTLAVAVLVVVKLLRSGSAKKP